MSTQPFPRELLDLFLQLFPQGRIDLTNDAAVFGFQKDGLAIQITLATSAMEWYVDVRDESVEVLASDWYDYTGYDTSDKKTLEEALSEDLSRFLRSIAERPLKFRVLNARKAAGALDWLEASKWRQVVPFSSSNS